MHCLTCQTPLVGKQLKFCSRSCKTTNSNLRNQNYACQQARGHTRKRKLIDLKGGECQVCGYAKNTAALNFHHRDPEDKGHSLDLRKLSNSTWQACIDEAKKCDLLCFNCHMEHHYPECDMVQVVAREGLEPSSLRAGI